MFSLSFLASLEFFSLSFSVFLVKSLFIYLF
jgi:hypothetical protein